MKKSLGSIIAFLFTLFSLSGCDAVDNKNSSMAIIYGATALLSVILLLIYCSKIKEKCSWYYLLFSSFIIVNSGYLALSVSTVVEEALLANRIAYFGSVFLPLAMFMIIWRACNFKKEKYIAIPLICISSTAFCIAATPGYSDIYYKSVELVKVNGISVLEKEYGPLHSIYMYYLLLYFGLMITTIIVASRKKKLQTNVHVATLLFAVSVNLLVWLMGQLVSFEFEFLSVSYIVCGLFLLCFEFMRQDTPKSKPVTIIGEVTATETNEESTNDNSDKNNEENIYETDNTVIDKLPTDNSEKNTQQKTSIKDILDDIDKEEIAQLKYFKSQLSKLTATEQEIYNYYLSGKTTKEIMASMEIKESTLKYHNRNLYTKLGVSSRKQLLGFAQKINK